ncbi:MAG: CsbD family protein [Alphaproteobacteria bacterium]|nr:CsbD family protein [Alphaproteobacteria bacterium]
MDKEHLKGAVDKASGDVKDAVGKVTGNDKLRVEGAIDKAKGAAHDALGDAKDAVKKADVDAQRDREADRKS